MKFTLNNISPEDSKSITDLLYRYNASARVSNESQRRRISDPRLPTYTDVCVTDIKQEIHLIDEDNISITLSLTELIRLVRDEKELRTPRRDPSISNRHDAGNNYYVEQKYNDLRREQIDDEMLRKKYCILQNLHEQYEMTKALIVTGNKTDV